jgi:hypothetical protein
MKREPVGNEREQDTWLGTMLRRQTATVSEDCLDAETLAAWADGGLDAKAAASVELHASSCSRCMAVLATLERTAPIAPVTETWTLARVFRWVAPLAAAATAVAIWVAVPEPPIAPVESTISQDLGSSQQVPVPVPGSGSNTEPGTANTELGTRNPEPGTRNAEPQASPEFRDDLRRERASGQAAGAVAAPAAPADRYAPEREMGAPAAGPVAADEQLAAPTATAPPPAAAAPKAAAPPPPAAPAPRAFAADASTESATAVAAQRSLSSATVLTFESPAPANPLIRWRILSNTLLERSSDGGKTWTRTNGPAPNLASVRAVDANRAVVTTSEKAEFYTTNGGQSWTRVQENSAAPF